MPTASPAKKKSGGPHLPRKKWSKDGVDERAAKSAQMKLEEDELRLIERWRGDHEAFVNETIIGPHNAATGDNYHMSQQQKEGSAEVTKLVKEKESGKSRDILGISIMSGNGTGKDAFTSWVIMWFLACFSYPKIPCTSVSADQLSKVLWSEIAKWLLHSPLKASLKLQNDLFYNATVDKDVLKKRAFAFPKAANPKNTPEEQVEKLAGIHERHLLQVVDEGSGVLSPVFVALERNMTANLPGDVNFMLLIFNPNRARCYAVDTQDADSDRWRCLRWNAEESELVDRALIASLEKKFGRESNPYRIRVLGLPPLVDEENLIQWDWIEDAVNRPVETLTDTPVIKGVDCGAGGDSSIIATRQGARVFPMKRLKTSEGTILENWIGSDIDAENPDVVRIDTIGIGWAVESNVREKKGALVEAADVRRAADDPGRFENKRAEMYWRLREAFEKGAISIPPDEELKNQLGAMKCIYGKRIKMIDKKTIKQELGHSPDEADALAITYFYPDSMASRKTSSSNARRREAPSSPGAWMAA